MDPPPPMVALPGTARLEKQSDLAWGARWGTRTTKPALGPIPGSLGPEHSVDLQAPAAQDFR